MALSDLYTAVSTTAGCIHAYAMQETSGTTITDGKAIQNGALVAGATLAADGPQGGKAILNKRGVVTSAVGAAFTIANNATDAALADTFTFVFAVRRLTTHPGRGDVFLHKGTNSYNVAFVNDALRLHKNGGAAHFLSTEVFKDVHKWHLVVIRKNGTTTSLRVDGVELTKASGTDQTYVANTTQISIGGEAGASGEVSMALTGIFNTYVSDANVFAWEALWTGKPASPGRVTRFGVHGERQAQGSSTDRIAINTKTARLHSKIVRSKANLGVIYAGATDPASPDWTRHDAVYQEVEQAGMENLAVLYGSPQWMNGSATDGALVPGAGSATDPTFLTWRTAWLTKAEAVIRRYMPGGTAGTKVRYFELWNEPNLSASWKSATAPSAAQYASLWSGFQTIMDGIDANYNTPGHIQVSVGVLGNLRASGGSDIAGITFLDSLVTTYGILFENLSIHPYDGGDPDVNSGESTGKVNDMGDVQLFRDYLQWKGLSAVKLWLTEFGFTVASLTEAQQSAYLLTQLNAIKDYWQHFTDIALVYADADWQGSYGLHVGATGTFTPRLAAQTFGQFCAIYSPERWGTRFASDITVTGPNDPFQFDSTRLSAFKSAMATRSTSPVDILCVGDSTTEGTGVTTAAQRWQDLLRDHLRTTYGVSGGRGYVPSGYAASTQASPVSTTGTAVFNATTSRFGLGVRYRRLTTSATQTLSFTGTGIDVYIARGSTSAAVTYAIDGETPISVPTVLGTTTDMVKMISRTGLTPGAHSIVITTSSASTFSYICGYMVYNGDENSGIRLWDSGHSGYTSADFVETNASNWNVPYGAYTPTAADLAIIDLGINDYRNTVSASRQTPAQMRTNLEALVAGLRSRLGSPSILMFLPYKTGETMPNAGGAELAPWSSYLDAIKALAQADGQIALVDINAVMGDMSNVSNPNAYTDKLHPSAAGYQLIADTIYSVLTRP